MKIRISRGFDEVTLQIAGLEGRWLEDAVRSAIQRAEAATRGVAADGPSPAQVRVRVGRPSTRGRRFALPMDWELRGGMTPAAVSGRLEVVEIGPGEAEIGVNMAPRRSPAQPDEERRRIDHTLGVATRCFLNRVFWTLESLSQFDSPPSRMSPPPADRNHVQEVRK